MGALLGKISVETPAHQVVSKSPTYEIWRYPASVAATVSAKDLPAREDGAPPTGDAFSNAAFRTLARYIGVFGNPQNSPSKPAEPISMTAPVILSPEPVSMTAPVIMDPAQDGGNTGMRMTFLLPKKYTRVEEAPVPTNAAVKLHLVEGGRCEAVRPFAGSIGSFDMSEIGKLADAFVQDLEKDGVKVIGNWNCQGYNPPFTLPWLKRNEIHVPVDATSYSDVASE